MKRYRSTFLICGLLTAAVSGLVVSTTSSASNNISFFNASVVEKNSQKIARKVFSSTPLLERNSVMDVGAGGISDNAEILKNKSDFISIKQNLTDIYFNFEYYYPGVEAIPYLSDDFLNKETSKIIELAKKESSPSLLCEGKVYENKFSPDSSTQPIYKCGSFFSGHFWNAVAWEVAVGVSWVAIITIWGYSIANDLYSLYNGNGFDGDWMGTLKSLQNFQYVLVIKNALEFKRRTHCTWSYKW